MKRQLLGRLITLIVLPLALFADVKESVDKTALYRGEDVTYTISVSGKDVEFPSITQIGGNPIISTSGAQNIRIVNSPIQKFIVRWTMYPVVEVIANSCRALKGSIR